MLVLGIGNTLLSDDGVGVHVLHALRRCQGTADDVEYVDGGTLGLALAPMVVRRRSLLVLDAARFDADPGAVAVFCGGEMDHFLASRRKPSAHEVGLTDLMGALQLEGVLPPRRALIAIQPHTIDWGEGLSAPVAAAVGTACRLAETLISDWLMGRERCEYGAGDPCRPIQSMLPKDPAVGAPGSPPDRSAPVPRSGRIGLRDGTR